MKRSLGALLLALIAAPASAEWVRVDTPNFVVFGEIGEKRTKQVAAEFERFRDAIGQILPGTPTTSAVPTTVVVFDTQRSFAPYKPRYNGKPVAVGGYFTGTESDNMIALTMEDRDDALRIIFHEYTHLVTANASRALPAWVKEGLAEFYSTFAVAPDGKGGVLGGIIPPHYVLLGHNALLPLEQLLTVDHSSPLLNEGQRRSIFYAQSWALVHMFFAGEPNRSKEFSAYIRLVAGGVPAVDAWRQVFGTFDVNKELKRYLASPTVRSFRLTFDQRISAPTAATSTPGPADVQAVLAALSRYGAQDDLDHGLRKAVEMAPPSMLARALLGTAKVRANQAAEALPLLFDAAAATSDWLVQYHVANGLTQLARAAGRQRDQKIVAAARAAIEIVLAARPQLAHALALKAHLQNDLEGAATAARARALAPAREDYVFLEAWLRADGGEFSTARNVLSVLLTPRFPPDIRDSARRMMGQIVEREQALARASAPPGAAAPLPESTPPAPPEERMTPAFREVKSGEHRMEGTLDKLECAANGRITLVVRISGELKRFAADAFSDVDFISYRDQNPGRITCGPRTPADPIYITWLPLTPPAAGITGRAVAVELLPTK